ncbi:hypothetical protein CRG49_008755 [Neisseria sp. N95_16]|uniref:Uncharacterized protein n=1 Tax=Neisseria brasiliensis TaxID=2666100 RepID=A0A5Q3RVB2_9NEIS|nr:MULTISPECIES: hypothetical protein [Neisseria]MRN37212.1 hypothetical protein [Neisseria brasiliensis]PJO09237.1 hypothetical protein CRG49_008755 [Neisseria sp. N95_16]PJO77106.1 hypothetical protein CWC45_12240 [Neisseria sp. N177_16]QGL24221.1 hypothetical protein GJV52_00825 [Neisseria brasiliensis]
MNNQTLTVLDDETLQATLSNGQTFKIRAPMVKDMEGLAQDLIRIKHTDTIQKLIGRITQPQITKLQYIKLSLSDSQVLNAAIDFFSAPPSAQEEMKAAMVELGYLSESESEQPTLSE